MSGLGWFRGGRVLSLFSGIGGFELGLRPIRVEGFSEVDPYACKVLAERFPGIPNFGDVHSVGRTDADLIVAGFPCQDLSLANPARKGLAGARSGLVREFVRVRDLHPDARFIVENVASMSDAARDEISSLLGVEPVYIDSADLGPAHRRRLYWANFPVDPVLVPDELPPWTDVLLPLDQVYHLALSVRERAYMDRDVGGRDHWAFSHHFDTAEAKAKCLTANLTKGVPYNVLIDRRGGGELIRKLHPVECERLMGFPDNWTASLSNSRRYKALGNSVHVGTIAHIARAL